MFDGNKNPPFSSQVGTLKSWIGFENAAQGPIKLKVSLLHYHYICILCSSLLPHEVPFNWMVRLLVLRDRNLRLIVSSKSGDNMKIHHLQLRGGVSHGKRQVENVGGGGVVVQSYEERLPERS